MGRRAHTAGVAVVALVLVALATVLNGVLPADDEAMGEGSFVRAARVGDEIDLRQVSVTVDEVVGSAGLEDVGSTLTSPGLWILVEFSVVAADESVSLTVGELTDRDGRSWRAPFHGRNELSCPLGPPGVRVGCFAVFEVPADAVPTLRLTLSPQLDQRFDEVADVDLGLSLSDVAAFEAAPPIPEPSTTLGDS